MAKTKELSDLIESLAGDLAPGDDLNAAVAMLKKRVLERALEAELEDHLGYEKHSPEGNNSGNSRNGSTKKTVITDSGIIELEVPRDREGNFEPQLVPKRKRRIEGFDDKIISLYARGMTVRDIQEHVEELYGVEVSKDLISRVTDQVLEEVVAWQNRALDHLYPIVYFDGFVVKVKDDGVVRNRSVHIVLAVNLEGKKEVLGLWMTQNEGAKFWLHVINDLKKRGVDDILITSVDGLKGFPEAIESVFPNAIVQTCIVHMVRNSLNLVSWKDRKAVAEDLKNIYRANTEEEALKQLDKFEETWRKSYPSIASSWRGNWTRVSPFFEFGPEIRRAIYTTNPIEALNRQLRKATKTRGMFPNDKAVFKLLWLAIGRATKKWTMPIRNWSLVLQQLAIHFEGRVSLEDFAKR